MRLRMDSKILPDARKKAKLEKYTNDVLAMMQGLRIEATH